MEEERRSVVRGLGIVLMSFAVLMLAWTFAIDYMGMLWMDVPMFFIGLGMVLYAWWDGHRAPPPPA